MDEALVFIKEVSNPRMLLATKKLLLSLCLPPGAAFQQIVADLKRLALLPASRSGRDVVRGNVGALLLLLRCVGPQILEFSRLQGEAVSDTACSCCDAFFSRALAVTREGEGSGGTPFLPGRVTPRAVECRCRLPGGIGNGYREHTGVFIVSTVEIDAVIRTKARERPAPPVKGILRYGQRNSWASGRKCRVSHHEEVKRLDKRDARILPASSAIGRRS